MYSLPTTWTRDFKLKNQDLFCICWYPWYSCLLGQTKCNVMWIFCGLVLKQGCQTYGPKRIQYGLQLDFGKCKNHREVPLQIKWIWLNPLVHSVPQTYCIFLRTRLLIKLLQKNLPLALLMRWFVKVNCGLIWLFWEVIHFIKNKWDCQSWEVAILVCVVSIEELRSTTPELKWIKVEDIFKISCFGLRVK